MAIDRAIAVGCGDIQRKGGLRYVGLFDWADLSSTTGIDYSSSTHAVDGLNAGASQSGMLFEFKDETATLNIEATKENGQTTFEISVEMYIPRFDSDKFDAINNTQDVCLFACVQDTNGAKWLLGISEAYENADKNYRNQTFGKLTTVSGTTSSAYTEENGMTLTFNCRQFELPWEWGGTFAVDTSAGTMTLTD